MKTYTGQLRLGRHDEGDYILFVSTRDEPLVEVLKWMKGKNVTVRYWITEKECSKDEAQEDFVRQLCGAADCLWGARYSGITGYLWTDEELNVGGHDIIEELKRYVGEWLILEVEA